MALRAALVQEAHLAMRLKLFWPAADLFLETTLPALFFFKSALVRPPEVLALDPLKTELMARFPLAVMDFFMAIFFMDIFFMDILAPIFIAFMEAIFIIFAMVERGGGFKQ